VCFLTSKSSEGTAFFASEPLKETLLLSNYLTQKEDESMNMIWKNNQSNAFPNLATASGVSLQSIQGNALPKFSVNLVRSLRQWLDQIEVHDPEFARFISNLIPAQCPFERDITFLGRKVGHIPPLCKLNPFYEQLVALRFRSLCFLADQCGEDIQPYCS
jgi:hypothetical protein